MSGLPDPGNGKYSTLGLPIRGTPVQIGRFNNLTVIRQSGPGMFLDAGDGRDILLPGKEIPGGLTPGQTVTVFVYRDSEDRLIATTRTPKIQVGQCAFLRVVAVNRVGAFLDWGMPKDLLVPFAEQAVRMEVDHSYVVTAYLDSNTDRVAASSRLGRRLKEEGTGFRVGQPVDLLIATRSDLGWKAVIGHTHVGLIFHRDAERRLRPGMNIKGFIKRIRSDDRRIDLAITPQRAKTRMGLAREIIDHLEARGGRSDLTDHASPEDILETFGVSKGYYKKTLGALYRERLIVIGDREITLSGTQAPGSPEGDANRPGPVSGGTVPGAGKPVDGKGTRSAKRTGGRDDGPGRGAAGKRGKPGASRHAGAGRSGGGAAGNRSRGRGGRAPVGSGRKRD